MAVCSCIILRKTPYRESSLVLNTISPEYGRLDFLLQGALKEGKKKFPCAALFREISVDFKFPDGDHTLISLHHAESLRSHDDIAADPETYMAACSLASFLLRHSRCQVELPVTYQALSNMLSEAGKQKKPSPFLDFVKLTFLNENGFVAVPQDKQYILDQVIAYASGKLENMPPFRESYLIRFLDWINTLAACTAKEN